MIWLLLEDKEEYDFNHSNVGSFAQDMAKKKGRKNGDHHEIIEFS